MHDTTAKIETLRTASATGQVHCMAATIRLIEGGALPKGNLFDGATQSLRAILPAIFHVRKILKGGGH